MQQQYPLTPPNSTLSNLQGANVALRTIWSQLRKVRLNKQILNTNEGDSETFILLLINLGLRQVNLITDCSWLLYIPNRKSSPIVHHTVQQWDRGHEIQATPEYLIWMVMINTNLKFIANCKLLSHIVWLAMLPCGHHKNRDFNSFMLSRWGLTSSLGALLQFPGVPVVVRNPLLHKCGSQLYTALLSTLTLNNPSLFSFIPATGVNRLPVVTTSVNH